MNDTLRLVFLIAIVGALLFLLYVISISLEPNFNVFDAYIPLPASFSAQRVPNLTIDNSHFRRNNSLTPQHPPLKNLPSVTKCDTNKNSQRDVFSSLGPVTDTSCVKIDKFGAGDEEKHLCMDDIDPSTPCLVFSLGSNNQWGFHQAVFARTHCAVKT